MAILHGNIISASDIYDRFDNIVSNLIDTSLQYANQINGALQQLLEMYNEERYPYVYRKISCLYNALNMNPYSCDLSLQNDKISEIITHLKNLEREWSGSKNSAHGGVPEYDNIFKTLEDRRQHPLHDIISGIDENYAADGRVNQSDFIGAYHFRHLLESLYGIISTIRDIAININVLSDTISSVKYVQPNENPYSDLSSVDNVTEISVWQTETSSCIFPFNDWVLNNDLNGGEITLPFDISSETHKRGYTGDPRPCPSEINRNNQALINKNIIGRQIVRNLINNSASADLSNFYELDNPNFGGQTPSGLVNDYWTLNVGEIVGENGEISTYRDVSDALSGYFYTDGQRENAIESKTTNNFNVVSASTVNDLFKEMNKLLVQISASLYGEYKLTVVDGAIMQYRGGDPRGGLGYPEVFSWYTGGGGSATTISVFNSNIITTDISAASSKYGYGYSDQDKGKTSNGSLQNATFLAKEPNDYISIRAGYPYVVNGHENLGSIDNLYKYFKSSAVPMTINSSYKYNNHEASGVNSISGIKYDNMTNSVYCYGTSNGSTGVYTIKANKETNAHKQVFTRYCISHPCELSVEQYITSTSFYNDELSDFRTMDVNAKYLFMPYMMYLNDWISSEISNYYNGEIINDYGEIGSVLIDKPDNKFVDSMPMPVQALNRDYIWKSEKILGEYSDSTKEHYDIGNIAVNLVKFNNGRKNLFNSDDNFEYNEAAVYYSVLGMMTVNEVNQTHIGDAQINISAYSDSGSRAVSTSITLTYATENGYNHYPNNSNISVIRLGGTNKEISVYYGYGNYKKSKDPMNPMDTYEKDVINTLYYDPYKFNDFYNANDLITEVSTYNQIQKYFTAGDANDYLGGNNTLGFNILWSKPISVGASNGEIKFKPVYTEESGTVDNIANSQFGEPWMIQGNFIFSANHSDKIRFKENGHDVISSYRYVPAPNPLSIDNVQITKDDVSTYIVEISGKCSNWNNNLKTVEICAYGDGFNAISASSTWNKDIAENYPDLEKIPFKATDIISSIDVIRSGIHTKYDWNKTNKYFDFKISTEISDELSSLMNIKLLVKNEDDGIRIQDIHDISVMNW